MSSANPSTESPSSIWRRRYPGPVAGPLFILFSTLAICVQAFAESIPNAIPLFDGAAANIASLIFWFSAFVSLYIWFCWFSSYSIRVRRVAFWIPIGAVAIAVACLRYEGVDGYMKPTFAFRWSPRRVAASVLPTALRPETHADSPAVSDAATGLIDLTTEATTDFPQFLGPRRDNRIPDLEVTADWSENPPRELWRREIGPGWAGFAVRNGVAVTIEQRDKEEWVTCYSLETGELLAHHAAPGRHFEPLGGLGPRSTPTIDDGLVYAQGAAGLVRCIDFATGKIVWQDDLMQRYDITQAASEREVSWGRTGSPLIAGNLVILPAGGLGKNIKSLIAYDKNTGRVVWEAGQEQIAYCSPVLATIGGVEQVLYVGEESLASYAVDDGRVLWRFPWPGSSSGDANVSQPVPLAGDRVLQTKGYGGGGVLLQISKDNDQFSPTVLWENNRVLKTKFTNVTIIDDHVYGLNDGVLECVELDSGKSKWKRGRYGHGQLIGLKNQILVLGETGDLALVAADPRKFRELGRIQALQGKTWNNLCVTGNRLLVRNGEQAVCYELK
jgi:outer membrane protein assembly factor BamB